MARLRVNRLDRSGDIGTSMETRDLRMHSRDLQAKAGLNLGGNPTGHSFHVGARLRGNIRTLEVSETSWIGWWGNYVALICIT